jgi:hypothetical protein
MSSDNQSEHCNLAGLCPGEFAKFQECLQETMVIYKRSRRRGRPMSTTNAQRLFARLWQAEGADRSVASVGRAMVSESLRQD